MHLGEQTIERTNPVAGREEMIREVLSVYQEAA